MFYYKCQYFTIKLYNMLPQKQDDINTWSSAGLHQVYNPHYSFVIRDRHNNSVLGNNINFCISNIKDIRSILMHIVFISIFSIKTSFCRVQHLAPN